ncbi:hypothetical protein KXJ69_08095 [Aureisphaera sp. CAU 1614]|uniref:Uncharacterized protein n=1 Tax=Halomarinibacterium sedimenti TaxID=2857106 RepID=A0A9X1FP11_9FLAO|nr:hypothetical protein [Halomarinibacterium sedimenti]MBW2938064.1 hypothetical protein [Halomarinibacterium sedimenti]
MTTIKDNTVVAVFIIVLRFTGLGYAIFISLIINGRFNAVYTWLYTVFYFW